MDASRNPNRIIRMMTMELLNVDGVQNEPGRDPAPFLRSVSLPVHQILQSLSLTLDPQQPSYCKDVTSIDDSGRRRVLGG